MPATDLALAAEARRAADPARGRAASPFLAQVIGAGLAKRRLQVARERAGEVHAAYRLVECRPAGAGARVDLSL